jgi:hypothetical protein
MVSMFLCHHGVNWRMGSSDHLAMMAIRTNKVTLKLEPGKSSEEA